MNLDELIERLQEIREDYGNGEIPIRGVQQPNYPLLSQIEAITVFESEQGMAKEIFIGLAEARDYGNSLHYADRVVWEDEEEDN